MENVSYYFNITSSNKFEEVINAITSRTDYNIIESRKRKLFITL